MQTFTLPDGRQLAYREMGDPTGLPVVYQHGWGYPRLWHPDTGIAQRAGVRLIGVDRAGYGQSTLQPDRTVADSAADVAALADHLGLDRFAMLGWSLGGLHALAAAAAMPQRVATWSGADLSGPQRAGRPAATPLDQRHLSTAATRPVPAASLAQIPGRTSDQGRERVRQRRHPLLPAAGSGCHA